MSSIDQDQPASYSLSARILTTAILSVTFVVVLLIVLHLYVRCVLRRGGLLTNGNRHNISIIRVGSETDDRRSINPQTTGLDRAVIAALPTFSYENNNCSGGGVECPICLSAVDEGEMVRKLPNCKHLFHVECVDMWLGSHSTCPVCRAAVGPGAAGMTGDGLVSRLGSSLRRMMSRERSRRVQAEGLEDLERGNDNTSR